MGVIHLVFVTRDAGLSALAQRRKSALVASERRKTDDGHRVEADAFRVDQTTAIQDVRDYLVDLSRKAQGLLVVSDLNLRQALDDMHDTLFLNVFPPRDAQVSDENHLSRTAAAALRDYEALRARAAHLKNLKILLLPLRNFVAPELVALEAACSGSFAVPRFAARLDRDLEEFRRKRQHPKRKSKSPSRYYVDTTQRHYSYGHEDHSRCETAHPHDDLCLLRRDFRFGLRIAQPERHFNVSLDQASIKGGAFVNCHRVRETCPRVSHMNVFPGGYLS